MTFAKRALWKRLQLIWGTLRRFIWNNFRPGYVRASLARRQGECRRCGACCQLVMRCIHYTEDHGVPSCRIYKWYRPGNCGNFPHDGRDIADRDQVAADQPCGYSFARAEKGCAAKG